MPDIYIRLAQPQDQASLVDLFHALWPDTSADDHGRELEAILVGNTPGILPLIIFVAEATDHSLVGFLEVGLRSHADSCDSSHPVGYVEGWYVAELTAVGASAKNSSSRSKTGRAARAAWKWPLTRNSTTNCRNVSTSLSVSRSSNAPCSSASRCASCTQ